MRVILINGSHRQGNSQFMLEVMGQELVKQGHQTHLVNLRSYNIGYVIESDYNCQKIEGCACCRDDLGTLYPLIRGCEVIVFGCPSYFANVPAIMKTFMDRLNPCSWNQELQGKKVIILGVGGHSEALIQDMVDILKKFSHFLGMQVMGSFITKGEYPDDVANDHEAILKLREFSQSILK